MRSLLANAERFALRGGESVSITSKVVATGERLSTVRTRQIARLVCEFRPARVKCVQIFLCRFHFGVDRYEARTVTGNRRIFQFCALAFEHPLGVNNALLDSGILPRFQVRELLFLRQGKIGEFLSKRCRAAVQPSGHHSDLFG